MTPKNFVLGLVGMGFSLILFFFDIFAGFVAAILVGSLTKVIFFANVNGIPLIADIIFWITFIAVSVIRIVKRYKEFYRNIKAPQ